MFDRDQSYAAPSATISWTPQNPDVDLFYVTLTGPGVSFSNVTSETSITFNDLRPGMNYTVTVVQQTNEPIPTNSLKANFEFHTNSTGNLTLILIFIEYLDHFFFKNKILKELNLFLYLVNISFI